MVQLECVEWYGNKLTNEGFQALKEEDYLSHHRDFIPCQYFVFTRSEEAGNMDGDLMVSWLVKCMCSDVLHIGYLDQVLE